MSVAKKVKDVDAVVTPVELKPINPQSVSHHADGQCWNEWRVILPEHLDFNIIREHPEVWKRVQISVSSATGAGLRKFDRVTIVLADESQIMEARVVASTGEKVYLTGERIMKFSAPDSTTGYADDTYRAYWSEGGFLVERKKDGVPMINQRFANIELAKAHIRSLYPKKIVG